MEPLIYMFSKKVIINSGKTKEEIFTILTANVEPWHRDTSTLVFEGKIIPDREFKINLRPEVTGYRTRISIVQITGLIVQVTGNGLTVEVRFSIFRSIATLIYVLPIILILISIFLYTQTLPVKLPWFIPLIFISLLLGNLYWTFLTDVKKVQNRLLIVLG